LPQRLELLVKLWFDGGVLPCLIFEDAHLLVVNKAAGLNTHAPSPYAGEGIYEWLRNREPRWASLAIVHRLDKETSGVLVFSKTPLANKSLTEQFTARTVHKRYVLLSDRKLTKTSFIIRSAMARAGDKYVSRPTRPAAEIAETHFSVASEGDLVKQGLNSGGGPWSRNLASLCPRCESLTTLEAEPLTGRTHQIRVHAAENGFPILGDNLYGGTAAPRLCLHAAEIRFRHPESGEPVTFVAQVDFCADARLLLRQALIDSRATDCWRVIHGVSDGRPGWYVDKLGDYLLSQSEGTPSDGQGSELGELTSKLRARGAYHRNLSRRLRQTTTAEASPSLVLGDAAPGRFVARENGMQFELSFREGYSIGLFLDQRENRRRLLTGQVAAGFSLFDQSPAREKTWGELLNTFAYTCGFSLCAARAGYRTTSIDLSKKYLEWGKRNFALNEIDAAGHEFLSGDVFEWLRRLGKKGRRFAVILLDPPTFSGSKHSGVFRAEKDYGKLINAAVPLLAPNGILFASSNAAGWRAEDFIAALDTAIAGAKRQVFELHYAPQPPDFPISREEPGYLKTAWLRVA
jgi:23S rRNA (cytosine1962-C5)-methyltransferase